VKSQPDLETQAKCWSETLTMEPIHISGSGSGSEVGSFPNSNKITFSIASFNVLAEAYLTPRSHKNLPSKFEDVVFHKPHRRKLLCQTLTKLARIFDILCLQELDEALREDVVGCLAKLGFGYVMAPREGSPICSSDIPRTGDEESTAGPAVPVSEPPGKRKQKRCDGCATFYKLSKWKCVNYEVINFDSLAEDDRPPLREDFSSKAAGDSDASSTLKVSEEASKPKYKRKSKKLNALSGIVASYRRRNAALLIELKRNDPQFLKTVETQNVIIANAHLYWHPGYEYVKLSQAHYLLHKTKDFAAASPSGPSLSLSKVLKRSKPAVIICGDMNSMPNSVVHKYLTEGVVDARSVAPWNFHFDEVEEQEELAKKMKTLEIDLKLKEENEDIDQDPVVAIDSNEDNDGDAEDDEFAAKSDHNAENSSFILPSPSEPRNNTEFPAYEEENAEPNSNTGTGISSDSPPMKYLLDITLNKFTRWLRILGLDAVIETAEEEKLRTRDKNM
jgi:mRNA deadenylase 3'-5' endonuclease subunit Ccr4